MRRSEITSIILGVILFLVLISSMGLASADTSPHPSATVYFYVTYNNSSITENFSASLLTCRENGCEPDEGTLCENGTCKFYYYRVERVPNQFKLLINLNGENFSSEAINFSWINPVLSYDININADDVIVTPSPNKPAPVDSTLILYSFLSFFIALVLTIILELSVLIIFLRKWKIKNKKWKKPIWTVVIADIISVPLVWLIFFLLLKFFEMMSSWISLILAIIIAEAFAVIFETCFIYWLNKTIINLKKSFILSLMMNLASFIIGGIILTVLLILVGIS